MRKSLLIVAMVLVCQANNNSLQTENFTYNKPMNMKVVSYRDWNGQDADEMIKGDNATVTVDGKTVSFDVCGKFSYDYTALENNIFDVSPVEVKSECDNEEDPNQKANELMAQQLREDGVDLQMIKLKAFDKNWLAWRTYRPDQQNESGMIGIAVQTS